MEDTTSLRYVVACATLNGLKLMLADLLKKNGVSAAQRPTLCVDNP